MLPPNLLHRTDLRLGGGDPGSRFLYRPGELLVAARHRDRLAGTLADWGCAERDRVGGVLRFAVPPALDVPTLARRLAEQAGDPAAAAPNHVLTADRAPRGGTYPVAHDPPERLELFPPFTGEPLPTPFVIGVVDTGIALVDDAPAEWFAGRVEFDPARPQDVADPLDRHQHTGDGLRSGADGLLDEADGHGTFVAGLVLREAPRATIRMRAVLDRGVCDDCAVAAAIDELSADPAVQILVLSFSGSTAEDAPPPAIADALDRVGERVVVAAAGNNGTDRPAWPAAHPAVTAVGAVDETWVRPPRPAVPPRAAFSNWGAFVDAYAGGVQVLGPHCTFRETGAPTADRPPQVFAGWALWSGTSFAAATVAGLIAARAIADGASAWDVRDEVLARTGGDLVAVRGLPPEDWAPYLASPVTDPRRPVAVAQDPAG